MSLLSQNFVNNLSGDKTAEGCFRYRTYQDPSRFWVAQRFSALRSNAKFSLPQQTGKGTSGKRYERKGYEREGHEFQRLLKKSRMSAQPWKSGLQGRVSRTKSMGFSPGGRSVYANETLHGSLPLQPQIQHRREGHEPRALNARPTISAFRRFGESSASYALLGGALPDCVIDSNLLERLRPLR